MSEAAMKNTWDNVDPRLLETWRRYMLSFALRQRMSAKARRDYAETLVVLAAAEEDSASATENGDAPWDLPSGYSAAYNEAFQACEAAAATLTAVATSSREFHATLIDLERLILLSVSVASPMEERETGDE